MPFLMHHIKKYVMLIYLTTGDVNTDILVKILSFEFLHGKFTIFSPLILIKPANIPFFFQTFTH